MRIIRLNYCFSLAESFEFSSPAAYLVLDVNGALKASQVAAKKICVLGRVDNTTNPYEVNMK